MPAGERGRGRGRTATSGKGATSGKAGQNAAPARSARTTRPVGGSARPPDPGRPPGAARAASTPPGPARPAPAGRRQRDPQLTRVRSRAGGVVAATTGLLGLSSTRRAAILAIVVCALALTVAMPLRNYVAQRQELAGVTAQQQALAAEVQRLTEQRERLSDPDEVAAEARSRLGYVRPGEVPYVVQLPGASSSGRGGAGGDATPWYRVLWTDLTEGK